MCSLSGSTIGQPIHTISPAPLFPSPNYGISCPLMFVYFLLNFVLSRLIIIHFSFIHSIFSPVCIVISVYNLAYILCRCNGVRILLFSSVVSDNRLVQVLLFQGIFGYTATIVYNCNFLYISINLLGHLHDPV